MKAYDKSQKPNTINRMKYRILILFMLITPTISAQYHSNSIGWRSGSSNSIVFNHFYSDFHNVSMAVTIDKGVRFSTYLIQNEVIPIRNSDNFFVYYGIGFHLGYRRYDMYKIKESTEEIYSYKLTKFVAGGDAIIGLEYRIYTVPFSFSVDYRPFFELFGKPVFKLDVIDFALTLKYHFK